MAKLHSKSIASFTAVRGTIPHRKTEDRLPKRTAGVAALDLLIKTSTLFSAFRRGWRYARTVGHTDIRQTQAPQSSRCGLIFEGNGQQFHRSVHTLQFVC